MRSIDAIQNDLHHHESIARELRNELREARLATCPIKRGDIVRVVGHKWDRSGGREQRVSVNEDWLIVRVDFPFSRPAFYGRMRRKDGSWGTLVRSIWGLSDSAPVIGHEDA